MKRLAATAFCFCAAASASAQSVEAGPDFRKMEQVMRIATAKLPADKQYRVVFASEDPRDSVQLRHWIVTVQPYPADYNPADDRYTGVLFTAPPCSGTAPAFCRIREIQGEPTFRGRFDTDTTGRFHGFAGNMADTEQRIWALRNEARAHPEWTAADVENALAGARYGPKQKKEFIATIPLKALEQVFGPMRVKDVSSMTTHPEFWPAYWKVRTVLTRVRNTRLVMYFEPFEGQLQSLYVSRPMLTRDPKTKKLTWNFPDE